MNLFLFIDSDTAGASRLLEGAGFSLDERDGSLLARRGDVVAMLYRHSFENDLGMAFDLFPMVCKFYWRGGVDTASAARSLFADAKQADLGVMLVEDLEKKLDEFHPAHRAA